ASTNASSVLKPCMKVTPNKLKFPKATPKMSSPSTAGWFILSNNSPPIFAAIKIVTISNKKVDAPPCSAACSASWASKGRAQHANAANRVRSLFMEVQPKDLGLRGPSKYADGRNWPQRCCCVPNLLL